MPHSLRQIAAVVFLGWLAMGFAVPGCGSRLGPVQATQNAGSTGRPNLADIVVEHSKECMEIYGQQLDPGRVVLESTVEVNEDRDNVGVTLGGLPETARDFGACMRNVLREMPIAEQPFYEAIERLNFHREHAGDSHDALIDFMKVIPGVPIVASELVLEAEGYTVVLPVTVKVVADLENLVDLDKATLTQIGHLALAAHGFEGIMKLAEQVGWVKTVRDEQAQSAAEKRLIGDVSLSPAPLPRPPPPPTSVIAKTAAKRVVTRAVPAAIARVAPAAIAASQADTPLLGPGDAIAVGMIVVALLDAGVLQPEDILAGGPATGATASVGAAGAAVGSAIGAAAATPTTTAQPAPTVAKPRKYPNQTCEDEERERLDDEMHEICNNKKRGFAAKCNPKKEHVENIPCSTIKLSIQQRQACLAARWKVQNECFGGKPDTKHKEEIDNVQNGIDQCKALEPINCAKGHPMAGK